MMVNHTKNTALGTSRTPATNSRIVRPLEILARKMPTKALHDSHQAIMKYVQESIHSLSAALEGVMKLSSRKFPAKEPTERTNRFATKPLGPVMKTKSPRMVAIVSVICEMYLMPRLTPLNAEVVNSSVSTPMTTICKTMVASMPKTVLSPSPI